MVIVSDLKLISAIISVASVVVGFYTYFRDIFKRKTTPHLYTWLIWGITQGTATVASWHGGGKFGAISLAIGTILVIAILSPSGSKPARDERFKTGHFEVKDSYHFWFSKQGISAAS
jgi:hypothetical protein